MRCWTMRPAELVIAATIFIGCARTGPASPPASDARPVAPPPADASPTSLEPQFVKIVAFDCMKHEVFPGETPLKGLIDPKLGIRSWHGGGPNGANWNVPDLRCAVRATTTCTKGRALLTLRVGQHIAVEREAPVSSGSVDFEAVLPEATWERGYDARAKAAALKVPFRTASFRAQVAIDCEAPMKASPASWRFTSVVAEDMFVAGFASGE